ncbi:carboxylesterase/lipase family protein [Phenylobacterium sp.]|uniref:carboxylesterase/lipase family protein n=1 Tax=Phenylobacterium sp. TaxID=1871053 RepID=UPI002B8E49E6|nr:carboxylesterase family protein [Phenylobacterium sp.]HLZ74199.1 carboxylesterase family protein [Phenylobacterium sp.]
MSRRLSPALVVAACFSLQAAAANAEPGSQAATLSPDVTVTQGALRGAPRDVSGVLAFKGVPYAAPPVGAQRWRAPQPARPWSGAHDATAFGPRCMALPGRGLARLDSPASEDCLSLNIWTAAKSSAERRPVMVWLHGGAFQFGAGAEPNTDGARLAAKGVVLVSLNYRLGVFGFLAHPDLDKEGAPSGNFGLQDQIAALKWVRANIAKFGGDPNKVTLFGESAGANSVGLLMTSPLAKGLFQRAIGESGAFWDSEQGSIRTHAEALARGRALADRLGGGTVAGLRAIPAEELAAKAPWTLALDPVTQAFSPNIDSFVVPEAPAKAFAEGRQAKVPLLAGSNGAEGAIFMGRSLPHGTASEFYAAAAAKFGAARSDDFAKLYPAATDSQLNASAETLMGDLVIREQVWEWLQMQARTGRTPVFAYQFDRRSAYAPVPIHSAEIDFVFGTLAPQRLAKPDATPNAGDRELSDRMMSYWINFARNGDPNGAGLPRWPAYRADRPEAMIFGDGAAAGPEGATSRFSFLSAFRTNGRLPEAWLDPPKPPGAAP